MEAGNPIHLRSGLMKPGEGLAQILSKDKKLVVGKKKTGSLTFSYTPIIITEMASEILIAPKEVHPARLQKLVADKKKI